MSAYCTIIEKRSAPVTADNFTEENRLTIRSHRSLGDDEKRAAFWNEHIPYMPSQIYRILTEGFAATPAKLSLYLDVTGGPSVNVEHVSPAIGVDSEVKYVFDGTPELEDCRVSVEPSKQGNGGGSAWLRTNIETLVALGGERFRYKTASEGSYVWARAGLNVDFNAMNGNKLHALREDLNKRLDAVASYMKPDAVDAAREYCRVSTPESLRLLASHDLGTVGRDVLSCKASAQFSRMLKGTLKYAFDRGFAKTRGELPVAQLLLTDTGWDAVVDFSDRGQMDFIGRKAGGWKTIAPIAAL